MFHDITVNELLKLKKNNEVTLVDVRSPSEYKEATIPGSINIPFFNDEERAEIGTIYKQVSPEAAKERGFEIVSAKLPSFVKEFSGYEGKKAVFCWRGGMRSKTSATVLSLMGIKVFRLSGGYRAYRNWVVEILNTLEIKPEAYVLNGYTGSGKTKILRQLQKEGYPVLDLEGMANHRGSIFGQIGLHANNQKSFDSQFIQTLMTLQESPFILFEGESKRIGKIMLPDVLMKKKENGLQLFIEMPIEERVRHILDDYEPWIHQKECLDAFSRIKRRIHTPIAAQIESDLIKGEFASAVELLLVYYYDPLYNHTANLYPDDRKMTIKVKNVDQAIQVIRERLSVKIK